MRQAGHSGAPTGPPAGGPPEADGIDLSGVPHAAAELLGDRIALAERFAVALFADDHLDDEGLPEFVLTYAVPIDLDDAPEVVEILLAARDIVRDAPAAAVRVRSGRRVVIRLHGASWTVVLSMGIDVVLVVVLDGQRYGWRVDVDAHEWAYELHSVVSAFLDRTEADGLH
jgi:hypothetical protein